MNIKKLIALSAVAGMTTVGVIPKAQANGGYCYTTNTGGDVCITRVVNLDNNRKRVWSVVNGHYSVENIYCNPSHRHNYRANMYGIACFQFS